MKLRWTPEAERERDEIFDYIDADNQAAAARMDALFSKAADRVANFPLAAREVDIPGTRELIPHQNYRLVYQIRGDEVWILAPVHTSRQWPPLPDEGNP